MVLRAAHRLDALSVRDATVVDIMRDVRRADEADRADVGMVEDRVDHFLVAMDGLENPLGHPGLEEEFGQAQGERRSAGRSGGTERVSTCHAQWSPTN